MRTSIASLVPLASACLLLAAAAVGAAEDAVRYLPPEHEGWKAAADESYAGDGIFEYLDGAGEVYRAYNYRNLPARRYTKPGQPDIVVDLFDMGSSADAFGVFSHGLEGERLEIGRDAVSLAGLLSFWKDRYFVSLYAESETPEIRRALPGLGRAIAGAIPGEGGRPAILSLVPGRFDDRNARYFHSHLILNYHHFISSENILLLGPATEAVLASSGEGPRTARLLIIIYPDGEAAARAAGNFARGYLRGEPGPGPVEVKAGRWSAAVTRGRHLFIVLGAPAPDEARSILRDALDTTDGNAG